MAPLLKVVEELLPDEGGSPFGFRVHHLGNIVREVAGSDSVRCGCGELPEELRLRCGFVDGPNVSHGDSAQTTPATTQSVHRLRESTRRVPTAISNFSLRESQL